MRCFGLIARLAGALCLGLAGVFVSGHVQAEAVCDAAWRAQAEQRAVQALTMSQDYWADNRVALWRLLTLGEGYPKRIGGGRSYSYPPLLILPTAFPDDPEVARIGFYIHSDQLDAAMAAIEALTKIPEPAQSDIATERLLVRSELLFAGVLWSTGWEGYNPVSRIGVRAQKWMALLNAHFLSLPESILNHDIVVNDAYWRAAGDFRWFLRSDESTGWLRNEFADDWWLQQPRGSIDALGGVAEAMRESDLLDWLQAMEETRGLSRLNWVSYLSPRFDDVHYANAFAHLRSKSTSLAWKIAVSQWWAPAFQHDPDVAGDIGAIQQTIADLEQRLETCSLTAAEQYALGPLRHHAMRFRVLLDQTAAGDLAWHDRIPQDEIAKSDDRTKREIARFALAVGRPDLARSIEATRSPGATDDTYGGNLWETMRIRAVTATDLDSFVAADPAPAALNLLPVRLLAELIEYPGLQPGTRAAIARLAWIRAYLLDDQPVLKRITPLLGSTSPPLKPLVDAYQSAWTEAGQRHAALVLLLKTPAMQLVLPDLYGGLSRMELGADENGREALFTPDHHNRNDGNWWCRLDVPSLISKRNSRFYDQASGLDPNYGWTPEGRMELPRAVRTTLRRYRDQALRDHPVMRQIDWTELNRLAELAKAPDFLTREALDWAESSWWDRTFNSDRVAEALALSVQVTRWSCDRDGPNGKASNAAYRALHRLFPDSEAAKNTPYWYN